MNKLISFVLMVIIGTSPVLSQNKEYDYSDKYIPRKYISDLSKPTLVMLTATWCGPCKYMKENIMKLPEVRQCLDSLNVLIIDVDVEGKYLKDKFSDVGYTGASPYFALLDPQGNYTDHITGRKDEEKFLTFIRKSLSKANNNGENEKN